MDLIVVFNQTIQAESMYEIGKHKQEGLDVVLSCRWSQLSLKILVHISAIIVDRCV